MRNETDDEIKDRHLHNILRLSVKAILIEDHSQLAGYVDDNWRWLEDFSRAYNAKLDKSYPATVGPSR